jgi:ChrR-like protein with cupin domain
MSGEVVDLRGGGLRWRRMTIPGSTPDVELVRLHVDAATRASVSLVRFPPGWQRPGAGHYPCAELFVVLDGALDVTGVRYAAGEYGYLPAGLVRADSRSVAGCLAVGWFSAPPDWFPGEPAAPATEPAGHGRLGEGSPAAEPTRRGRLGEGSPAAGGAGYGVDTTPAGPVAVPTELLWAGSGRWCLLSSGATPPRLPGPVLVRPWP